MKKLLQKAAVCAPTEIVFNVDGLKIHWLLQLMMEKCKIELYKISNKDILQILDLIFFKKNVLIIKISMASKIL